MDSSSSSSAQIIPQILSRSDVKALSEGLDAGDILECYALVRSAPLHNAMLPDAQITIHKAALGIRYRPLKLNDAEEEAKIREITLEYGPQRIGASLTQESMPSVQREQVPTGPDGSPVIIPNNKSNGTDTTGGNSFLTWENEGKVYYTNKIASTGYIGAYYMASVSGAVLGSILDKAAQYPMANAVLRGRQRRYQPFVVVDGSENRLPPPGYEGEIPDEDNKKVLLKSSNSIDFIHYMWRTLAELGVSLNPILAPPTYEIQLVATGVEKMKVGPPTWVTHSAASFYDKLYSCIEAKVTGDYSKFTKAPTASPTSPAPSQDFSQGEDGASNSTISPDEASQEGKSEDGSNRSLRAPIPRTPEFVRTEPPIEAARTVPNQSISELEHEAVTAPSEEVHNAEGSSNPLNALGDNATSGFGSGNNSFFPTISLAPSIMPSSPPSVSAAPTVYKLSPKDTKNEVDKAQQAADQAKQAAAEAKDAAKTETDSKAADAAQVAADAAQKAADATNTAAAQSAMEAFLSGDGNNIIPIISPCFSDPQFGISSVDANGTVITPAYLYLDGNTYYKLNLTAPYIQIVPIQHTLPQPKDIGSGENADVVDYLLTILLLILSIFGILMLIQQICGGYIKLYRPLYYFQRWFFNPLHYKDEEKVEEERRLAQEMGGGQAYSFGEDVIPISMGGKRALGPLNSSPISQIFRGMRPTTTNDDECERIPLNSSGEHDESDNADDACEIELTTAKSPQSLRLLGLKHRDHRRSQSVVSDESDNSYPSLERCDTEHISNGKRTHAPNGGIVKNIELVDKDHRTRETDFPSRLARDPNLVDMPNLKSTSKVAIPAGLMRNNSFHSTSGNTL